MAETKKRTKDTLILKTLARILENQKKLFQEIETINENVVAVAEIVDELSLKEKQ